VQSASRRAVGGSTCDAAPSAVTLDVVTARLASTLKSMPFLLGTPSWRASSLFKIGSTTIEREKSLRACDLRRPDRVLRASQRQVPKAKSPRIGSHFCMTLCECSSGEHNDFPTGFVFFHRTMSFNDLIEMKHLADLYGQSAGSDL